MVKLITGHIPYEEIPCPDLKNYVFPENCRHPDDFMGFCEWLVERGVTEDITIYTYSPMIIECIDYISEDYEQETEFIFYSEEGEKSIISEDELFIIYDDLAKVYNEIDILRLRMERYGKKAEREKTSCCKVKY